MKACFYRRTSLGMIRIEEENERITRLSFESEFPDQEECEIVETACLWQAFVQLRQYLDGERQQFELILQPQGTAFQKEAWQALLDIPYGQTRTYRQQAESIGRPKAVRAIGMANHRNPIPIFIPCHRVIGSRNGLVGYRGGLAMKKQLLELERTVMARQREEEIRKTVGQEEKG